MIILNGKKLAESEKEFTESLFSKSGTCVGYAKRNKKSVTIMNAQKEKVGAINRHGVLCSAMKTENSKTGWWYSFEDIDIIGKYESYLQCVEECQQALKV
jgi:hypothetical protein